MQSRSQVKRKVVRKTAVRHVYRDKLTVFRGAGKVAVRGFVTDQLGQRTVVPRTTVPESVVASLPREQVFTERYAPIQQAVFLRFHHWKTLTGKTNGKRRVNAVIAKLVTLFDSPLLNHKDNPDRLDNGFFRLMPRTPAHLAVLQRIVDDNADILSLSESARPSDHKLFS